jgi:FkbM family methyltransferase
MAFISYAQNLEDVILWRVFKNVKDGFYIDVGANDPLLDSVTKAFYDHGWRGINIEPAQDYYQRLCRERIGDINLSVAISAEHGVLPFYEIQNTGLSTLNGSLAERYRQTGYKVITRETPVMTLSSVCHQYANNTIHFLKIDVEGSEKQALLGMNFRQFRPWVVVVESTIPLSQVENYFDWESILLNAQYQFVYFDGLNRFYVANEKAVEYQSCFSTPPNAWDMYQRYSEYNLLIQKNTLEKELGRLAQENQILLQQRDGLLQENQLLVQKIEMLLKSPR